MSGEDELMQKPAFRSEINWNTIAVVIGFVGTFIALGVTWGQVRAKIDSIDKLDIRMVEAEKKISRIDSHEIRLNAGDDRQRDMAAAVDKIQSLSNELAGDMKAIREILQRIEEKQKRLSLP